MKPYRERLPVVPDASWSLLNRRLEDGIPFQWHHHPEFELTLTLNSLGQRFIGDHVESFDDGDLVLVGPNLPHTWSASERLDPARPHVALVMWFRPEWAAQLGEAFVELRPVAALAARAGRGLRFSAARARAVRPRIEALFAAEAPQRLLALMDVLGNWPRTTRRCRSPAPPSPSIRSPTAGPESTACSPISTPTMPRAPRSPNSPISRR